ncbi:MAG: hypothetical protein PHD72_00365 [Patescibacteria group bacterium]|nr:hypothetical protein [Patescibacteria group bacterium]
MKKPQYKIQFKEFNFENFLQFDRELVEIYQMGEVRYRPEGDSSLFNQTQLRHTAPQWDINNENGFLNVWKRNVSSVRQVTFDQFHKSGSPRISIKIDLDKKIIFFYEASDDVEENDIIRSINKYFSNGSNVVVAGKLVNRWWKYTHPIWWVSMFVFILYKFVHGSFAIIKKTKILTMVIVPIIVTVVGGIILYCVLNRISIGSLLGL